MKCLLILLSCLFCLPSLAQDRIFYEHWHLQGADLPLSPRPDKGSQFGASLASLGDLDGDGFTEVAMGQPGDGQAAGQLWVLSLDTTGTVQRAQLIERPSTLASVYTWQGRWGSHVEALGDWDGDGIADLAVSEPAAKLGVLSYGIVWLLTLNRDGSLKEATPLHGRVDGLQGVVSAGQYFGQDVAVMGDLDGNGQPDLAVGAPGDPDKAQGGVYLLLMANAREVDKALNLKDLLPEWAEQLRLGDQVGFAVESAGDLDHNGYADLLIGAPGDDATGLNQGTMYVVWLGAAGNPLRHQKLINGQRGIDLPLDADDRWASSLARIDGLLGDSLTAIATGVPLNDDGSKNRGGVYVLGLDTQGEVRAHHKISFTTPNFEGESSGEYRWGQSLNPGGDLDRDGRPDLLVNGDQEMGAQGSGWVLRPTAWPERLRQELTYAQGAFQLTAADSSRLYAQAKTAADSARIDSLYDLSGYAPTHLILLLDVSASMSQAAKLPLLREAFVNLLPFLRPEDKVSIITYSGKPTLQLAAVTAEERDLITQTIEGLQSEGGTKPRKALEMAYELAEDRYIPQGNNRIIFATDGGFNPDDLDRPLTKSASTRIPMSVFYFGKMADYQIEELRVLAGRGQGNAAHITSGSVTTALLREVKMIRRKE
jgi:Mg-chelatase subunit ChlD